VHVNVVYLVIFLLILAAVTVIAVKL